MFATMAARAPAYVEFPILDQRPVQIFDQRPRTPKQHVDGRKVAANGQSDHG